MPEEKINNLAIQFATLNQRFTDDARRSDEQHKRIDHSLLKIDGTLSDIFREVKKTNVRVNKIESEREIESAKIKTFISTVKFFGAVGFGGAATSILPLLFDIFTK